MYIIRGPRAIAIDCRCFLSSDGDERRNSLLMVSINERRSRGRYGLWSDFAIRISHCSAENESDNGTQKRRRSKTGAASKVIHI